MGEMTIKRVLFLCWVYQLATARVVTNEGTGSGDSPFMEILESGSGMEDVTNSLPANCTPEYEAEVGHTMCMVDDIRVVKSGISKEQQAEIVKYHNLKRANVRPSATDLSTLIWDDKLAAVADKWAKQCIVDHDKNRHIPSYGMFIGQNVAAGYRNWHDAMASWYNEVEIYRYGENADEYLGPRGWRQIGHYTQMVQNTTFRVGCGYADCTDSPYGRYYVCNYAKGQSRTNFPYTTGERCSACPNSCKGGLCDCGGKLCLNKGYLDIDTCTCRCQQIYKGDDCSQLKCPEKDAFYCRRDLLPDDCDIYANVPILCPYMCGICGAEAQTANHTEVAKPGNPGQAQKPAALTIVTTTPTPVFTSPHNCTYSGLRSTPAECKKFGDRGMDMQFCESRGGKFTCNDCERYYNVKRDYCPVMCGICDAPCGGKECMNGGTLDIDTCQCKCSPLFTGDTCETLSCPETDKWHCKFFNPDFCTEYVNVPLDCPYLCGTCA